MAVIGTPGTAGADGAQFDGHRAHHLGCLTRVLGGRLPLAAAGTDHPLLMVIVPTNFTTMSATNTKGSLVTGVPISAPVSSRWPPVRV